MLAMGILSPVVQVNSKQKTGTESFLLLPSMFLCEAAVI